ncbi:uncharacterized protein LOC128872536 isoform X2 [Hylaeus volcanicus]|uniref:uncharacterized protein LOC128872536 isoform X2 n=1 Tax=Hylaeus volcanicus TaxID=313075 RepID=UPI0023B85214|nr:uncharacterized protein LOC128872536 isoform X2 [Hylaeus volcanicus]
MQGANPSRASLASRAEVGNLPTLKCCALLHGFHASCCASIAGTSCMARTTTASRRREDDGKEKKKKVGADLDRMQHGVPSNRWYQVDQRARTRTAYAYNNAYALGSQLAYQSVPGTRGVVLLGAQRRKASSVTHLPMLNLELEQNLDDVLIRGGEDFMRLTSSLVGITRAAIKSWNARESKEES